LGKGRGGVEWKEKKERQEGAEYGGAGNGNAEKIAPKCKILDIMGTPLGGFALCHTVHF